MREIVLDTETTGLDPAFGHRLVEIAALELHNHVPTGRTWHAYVNPERDMPPDALAVHGLTQEFLSDKPRFDEIVDSFLEFVGDAPFVIHNGAFDMGFLNAELQRCRRLALPMERLICTLELARKRFSGSPNSLDALCRRFGIDLSARTRHGALVDCELLAAVYLELLGGRQPGFVLAHAADGAATIRIERPHRPPRPHAATAEEIAVHRAFIATLESPIWAAE